MQDSLFAEITICPACGAPAEAFHKDGCYKRDFICYASVVNNDKRLELRSADPLANPYIAFALMIYAGLYGIDNKLSLPESTDLNLLTATQDALANIQMLPASICEAAGIAKKSSFIADYLPAALIDVYCKN